ncbi:MAG: response regulator [Deltaproteobacteria bacterium]|nr:MAG: response regulator [Deltaproteobacteria bacterium]
MRDRKKQARRFDRVSHLFLSGKRHPDSGEESAGKVVPDSVGKSANQPEGTAEPKETRRRLATDFSAIFDKLISTSDAQNNGLDPDTPSSPEEVQDTLETSGSDLTLMDFLPEAEKEVASEPDQSTPAGKIPHGDEPTLLFVDAAEHLLHLGKQLLSQFGYRVLTAVDCESALELFSDEWARIDLVILELIMPRMGGIRCLEELARVHPEIRVLVTSGIADADLLKRAMEAGADACITKPYSFSQIVREICKILEWSGREAKISGE